MTAPVNVDFSSGTTISSAWLNGVNDHVNNLETSAHSSDNLSYTPSGTGAVATTVQTKLRESVSVKDFGAVGNGTTDDTVAIQSAITSAWKSGKPLYVPAGTYLITSTLSIPPGSSYEYRADSFTMYGDGAANGFLSYTFGHGTTFITSTDIPILTYTNYTSNGNNLFIEKIRFQQNNSAATQPVLYFQIFMGWSKIQDCEVYQAGTGDGIKMDYAYGGTISDTVVMNRDLVSSPGTRVGTGLNISSGAGAGGLMKLMRVSSRGWLNAFNIGYTTNSIISTVLDQCECSTSTNGIIVNAGVRKTIIDACYFEGITGICVQDKGNSTTVSNCFFFEGYTTGIDSTYVGGYGGEYFANQFNVNTASSTCIAVYSAGDALGYKKTIDGNFIYFLGSGGSTANVVGVALTGSNPCVNIINNTFRPRRAWVGGSGTTKFLNSSTGTINGAVPVTSSLDEFSHQVGLQYSLAVSSAIITEADVVAGVLTLPDTGTLFNVNMSVATNITSINIGNGIPRVVYFYCYNSNPTFVKGTRLEAPSNYTPGTNGGMLCVNFRIVGGLAYSSEISRSSYV